MKLEEAAETTNAVKALKLQNSIKKKKKILDFERIY